jgi:transposase
MKEIISLSRREMQRVQVLEQVVRGALSLRAATAMIKVCYRQAKRLLARYRKDGPKGLAHQRRGRTASNALGPEIRERILALHREVYAQFNDTHFVEMLKEREGLRVGRETVRRWLREAGIRPKRRRRPPQHRSRRPRRPQIGLLMQWDGSPHRWFGPQQPAASLLHATDDATNTVLGALFRPQEDAIGYLRLLDMVLRRHGIPAAVYQDRHSALFRNDNYWSHEEELAGVRFPTHVGRIFQELGTETIPAFSPQGKGRIERQGGTFQDRLTAEMALEGIIDIDRANVWLDQSYLDRFNARFVKKAEMTGSAFRKISAALRYQLVSFAYEATVANDNTVRLGGLIIDIPPGPRHRSYARRRVLVRQHLDGAWTVWLEGCCIGRHGSTPLREPFRSRRPHQHGETHHTRHILQVYYETTPAPNPKGHFRLAVEGTS